MRQQIYRNRLSLIICSLYLFSMRSQTNSAATFILLIEQIVIVCGLCVCV